MLKDALGSYRGSLNELNRLLSHQEGNAMAYYDRANLKHGSGDHAGAIADYTRALKLGIRKREAFLALGNRAMAFTVQGRYAEAIEDYTRIIDAKPRNGRMLKTAYEKRAELYRRIGDLILASLDTKAAKMLT